MSFVIASHSLECKHLQVETLPPAAAILDMISRFYVPLHGHASVAVPGLPAGMRTSSRRFRVFWLMLGGDLPHSPSDLCCIWIRDLGNWEEGRRTCWAMGKGVWAVDMVPSAAQTAVEAARQSHCFQCHWECWGYWLYCRPFLACFSLCSLCKEISARSE